MKVTVGMLNIEPWYRYFVDVGSKRHYLRPFLIHSHAMLWLNRFLKKIGAEE